MRNMGSISSIGACAVADAALFCYTYFLYWLSQSAKSPGFDGARHC